MANESRSKRFLSLPSFTELFGTVFLALGTVLFFLGLSAFLAGNPVEMLSQFFNATQKGVTVRNFFVLMMMGLFWSYVGLGLRRHWHTAKLILFLYFLSPALHHITTLPTAIISGKNLPIHIVSTLIWIFLVHQVAKHHLVDIVLLIPGMRDKLTAAITGNASNAIEDTYIDDKTAQPAGIDEICPPWRRQLREGMKQVTLRELWSRYVLTFSGAALIFEVFKNLEIGDGWLLANKTFSVCGIFLLPALISYAWIVTDEASKVAAAEAEAETTK